MNLDSIDIRLSVSADKAAKSLEGLKTSLAGLSAALAPASSGLESMVVSLGKLVGMQSGLSSISKTFSTLANSWTALNASTNKSAAEMAGISDKARTMSQSFAKEYGIKSKGSVQELTNAFHKLYSSVGDTAAMGQALGQIDHLIRSFAQLKGESTEAGIAIREALQATTVKLPEDLRRDLGANLIKQMGKLSHVSKTEGALPSEIVKEINRSLDPNALLGGDKDYSAGFIDITGIDNEAQILEKLVAALTAAEGKTMTFYEAAKQDGGVITHLDEQLNAVATSLGTTLTGSIESYLSAAQRINEISPELARQFMQFDTAIDNIAQNGNPFEAVLGGLTQLQDIHLSDSLNNITAIKDAISKFGGDYAGRAAANLPGIASALKQFDGFTVPPIGEDLMNLAAGMSKLGGKKIADAYEPLTKILSALTAFNGLTINQDVIKSVALLGDALYKFGLAKMDKAVENIPKMAQSISQLVNQLSTMPAVSENTIRLVSALGNVNVTGNMAANTMGGRLSNGLKKFSSNAFNARKASMSLASAFGRMYANFFIFFRLARRFAKDIDLASQLTEIQNVVDVTFGDMSDKMNDFAKTAVDTLGMSELTAKQIGSKYQAMGTAMGISKSMAQSTNDFVQKATNGYADVANSMADISINLTRLAGDMASFYNQDYADVAEKLQAIFTGQTKPLRAYGIDLTNATLKEWALNHGMEVNIKTMTQAEKTLLRYQYVMAQTAAAHGDFERTQTTWANSVRIATERLNQLRIVLGKIAIYTFKPLVQSFNRAMEQIIKGAEGLLNALGKIFGWQIEWSDGGIINEEADDADDLAENMGDAADNAKKFKNFLLGIDELNLLPDNSDKDKGGKDGLGGLGKLGDAMGGFNIKPVEKGFDSLYDTLYKLGKKIGEVIKNLLKNIDWDKVYNKARRFGRDIAEFLNGLLSDSELFYEIGKFFSGGINTIANAIDAYSKEFNGWQWGVDLANIINGFNENLDWAVIKSAAYERAHDIAQETNAMFLTVDWSGVGKTLAEGLNTAFLYLYTLGSEINWSRVGKSISETINSFFSTFDFELAGDTINKWSVGILNLIYEAISGVNWNQVGKKIGEFIKKLNIKKVAAELGKVLVKIFNAGIDIFVSAFGEAPFETALITLFGLIKGNALSPIINKLFGEALKNLDTNWIAKELTSILSRGLLGVGAGFAEFFTFKDTFKDLYLGVEDVGNALLKLGGVAVSAGAIMTSVFGFPAGTIAAGVIALTGEIVGIGSALIEVQREADKLDFAKSISNEGVGIGEYISGAADSMRNAYDDYNNLARRMEETDLTGTKKNIERDMKEIGLAIESLGTSLGNTELTVSDKLDAIEKLFENFRDNVSSLFSEELSVITEMGISGQATYYAEMEATLHNIEDAYNENIAGVYEKMEEYRRLFEEGVIPYDEFEGAMRNQMQKLNSLYSSLASEENSKIAEASSQIDFSKFFLGEETIDSVSATLEELSRIYVNGIDDIGTANDKYYETLLEMGHQAQAMGLDKEVGWVAKEIAATNEKEAQLIQDANDEYISALENIESQAWAKIGEIIANPEHLAPTDVQNHVNEYVNTVFIPLEEAITAETGRIGVTWKTGMTEAARGIADDMSSALGGMRIEGKDYGLDFDAIWNERYASKVKEMGTAIEGLSKSQSLAKKSALEFAESQGQLGKEMTGSGKKMNDTFQTMSGFESQAGLAVSGVTNIKDALEKTVTAGDGVKNISTNFSTLITNLTGFTGAFMPIKTGFDMFATDTQNNMTKTSAIFGESFTNIIKYGNQTIAWMKGSFIPMFSGAYWNSITSSIPTAFGNAFKQATNIMVNLWKQFAQWANQNMKMKVNMRGKEVTGVEVNIPQYDTGGFPEDGMFMANHNEMVGQFANGKTAVANNEQIVEGIRQGVYDAVTAAMANGGQGVTVELVGDASDIFTAVVKENNRSIMRTGASPIRV